MWSSKSLSGLQKTYDESYLKCSTAVYYESQGDEKEAMICWRNALDQIRTSTAHKSQTAYVPNTETERALVESLKELEIQCKERIDLLEVLSLSRRDATLHGVMTEEGDDGEDNTSHSNTPNKGWIGDGTIPAITYPELSRPTLPQRPSIASRGSDERVGASARSPLEQPDPLRSSAPPSLPRYSSLAPSRAAPRSPSPDKHTMRTTLRSGRSDKLSKASRPSSSKPSKAPGAGKAATMAWSTLNTPNSEPRRSQDQAPTRLTPSQGYWDSHTRRLVTSPEQRTKPGPGITSDPESLARTSGDYGLQGPSPLALGAASSALSTLSLKDTAIQNSGAKRWPPPRRPVHSEDYGVPTTSGLSNVEPRMDTRKRKPAPKRTLQAETNNSRRSHVKQEPSDLESDGENLSSDNELSAGTSPLARSRAKGKQRASMTPEESDVSPPDSCRDDDNGTTREQSQWGKKKKRILKNLPPGVDEGAAKAIFNEIVVEGDIVHWSDIAGLAIAKSALREAVVYPFLRPDLFMGLREPARGMLLFGPPGTGKTMLARAVATESKSTFFSISASSLTSKYLGESEKLVRALFALAKAMAPSIIFVDEIDSLLSQRSGSGEHEASRRIKTEFLIQWSDLQRAAAGRESSGGTKDRGDATRVLVLAATNLPWAIDEAARRRFVRRQYIPLPEAETRATQLHALLGQQKHSLTENDIGDLVRLTDGFSGSDITALAKDAAMGPLRSLGEALLHMTMDQIRPIELGDFQASLRTIRPSVSREGLKQYEDWARQFGERGG